MKFITGKDRNQTEFFCLEQAIAQDNEVRLIDLFVASIKRLILASICKLTLAAMGQHFLHLTIKNERG